MSFALCFDSRVTRLGVALTLAALRGVDLPAQSAAVSVLPPSAQAAVLAAMRAAGEQSRAMDDRGAYHLLVMQRTQTGSVEVHASWDDLFVVVEGTATLRHGGIAEGGAITAPGEYRGGTMRGGVSVVLTAGTVVTIPAGTPHQFLLAPDARVGYLAYKIRQPTVPLPVTR